MARTSIVGIRVADDQRKDWESAASSAGVAISEWARSSLDKASGRIPEAGDDEQTIKLRCETKYGNSFIAAVREKSAAWAAATWAQREELLEAEHDRQREESF